MDYFIWSDASKVRNQLTEKYEPLQPFLFLSFLEFSGAQAVLDVGANVGYYSLLATIASKVESVFAFEPDPAAYPELVRNISLNGLDGVVTPFQVAVSNVKGKVSFGSHSPMSGVNGVVDTSIHDLAVFSQINDVPAITLTEVENVKGKVLGLKIDVEGHELNVINGAAHLLATTPAIIQVEHYVGSQIDERLMELGYFSFFTAGQDHYFTNISNFTRALFVKRAVEYAVSWLIETQSGRFPSVNTINSSLVVSCSISDNICVNASLKQGFFAEPEYAFYLMVNGEKVDEHWYQVEPTATFSFPENSDSIEVKAFVREKNFPDKKVVVGEFIKRKAFGHRAASAVTESLGSPSQYASLASRLAGLGFSYPELDITSLLCEMSDDKPSDVILIGGGLGVKPILNKLRGNHNQKISVIASKEQLIDIEGLNGKKDSVALMGLPWVSVLPVEQPNEMDIALATASQGISSKTYIILIDQFLTDVGQDIQALSPLLEALPVGSKLYAEGLTNALYRKGLVDLANHYDVEIRWLYPLSSILPLSKTKLNNHRQVSDRFSLSWVESLEEEFELQFFVSNNVHSERALGLDFSLPEDKL